MMYIVLCYDVASERVSRIRKITKKYLRPVQKSVFEGYLSEGELNKLKKELFTNLNGETDQLRIYIMRSTSYFRIDEIGLTKVPESQFL